MNSIVCKYNAQPDINVKSTVKQIFSVDCLEFSCKECYFFCPCLMFPMFIKIPKDKICNRVHDPRNYLRYSNNHLPFSSDITDR